MLPKITEAVKKYGKGLGEKKSLIYRTDVDKLDDKELNVLEEQQHAGDIQDKV